EAADVFLRESERFQKAKLLMLLEDGWEDKLRSSIYAAVAAGIDSFPIVLSLDDLTGERGNADKCLEIAEKSLELMGAPEGRNLIALTTDNPTTMQSFRRKFQDKFFWVLIFACFLHSLNTLVGEICSYPLIKKIITKANRSVTFFNGSHYWGGQLKDEAKRLKITRGLKKNCESRWYALVLLCVSVISHRQPLSITCLREDAQKKTRGLSAVAPDVIQTILRTTEFWPLLAQLTRITKPIVDAIGNSESRQTTLADCMLELIRCARAMSKMELEEDEDEGFLNHAKQTFDRRFRMIATPIYWLALFLHPLCRKLAVSQSVHGHSLDFRVETALGLAKQWKWSVSKAMQLKVDLKAYHLFKSPFGGGHRDAREWWGDVPKENHEGIRELSILLANVVPHSAEVERLFSGLGGIQTARRSTLTVEHMEKMGKVRSRLSYELYVAAKQKTGTTVHRKHNHMHTQPTPGINAELAKDLENPITWIPPLDGNDVDEGEDIVDKAYQDLQKTLEDEEPLARDNLGSVIDGELVDWEELERVVHGESTAVDRDNMDFIGNGPAASWSVEDLMMM
ncbi:ribonuclease H-like domain-containing protein, partial [Mycena sanguinolenta]